MFSKTRVPENRPQQNAAAAGDEPVKAPAPAQEQRASGGETAATPQPPRKQASPSVLSSDLIVTGNIRTAGHVVIQSDSLTLKAGKARGRRDLEINSVRGGGHDLQLHAYTPLG